MPFSALHAGHFQPAAGAYAVKFNMIADNFKTVLLFLGDVQLIIDVDIKDFFTPVAYQMMMRPWIRVKAFLLGVYCELLNGSLFP